jgi:hypothetical protein
VKELSRWFERRSRREQRAVFLEDALLSDRSCAYAWYRLRYFSLHYLAAAFLHGIVVLLLASIFSQRAFVEIALVHAVAGLLTSFWWGGLEVMRGRIRELRRHGRPHLIAEEIGRWLCLAIALATATLLAAGSWAAWHVFVAEQAFEASDLYVLSIALGLALTLVNRCFHSGVYAIRRIYRPLAAIVIVQLVGFGTLPALWPWLGAWSFPLAAIVSTLTTAGITLHYTARVYRFFDFRPLELASLRRPRLPRRVPWGEFFAAGSSYGVMKLDAFLVLSLFGMSSTGAQPGLFALLFAMSPTIRAGFDWAQLFYFDFKRLEVRPFSNLRRRYERFVIRLASVLGVVFWLFGSLTVLAVYGHGLGIATALFLPFFLSRSLVAYLQIRAYAARHYAELLGSGAVCLAGMFALRLPDLADTTRLVLLSASPLAAFGVLALRQRFEQAASGAPGALAFTEWLATVSAADGAVRVRALRFEESAQANRPNAAANETETDETEEDQRWKHVQVAQQIARRLGRDAAVTVLHPSRILWLEHATEPAGPSQEFLAGLGAGLVREIAETGVEPDGRAALRAAALRGLLGSALARAHTAGESAASIEDLRRSFERAFPKGAVYAPDETPPALLRSLPARDRRSLLFDALRFSKDFRPSGPGSRYDVTALCESGDLRLLFVADRRADRRLRSRWRARIQQANLGLALGAAVTAGPS